LTASQLFIIILPGDAAAIQTLHTQMIGLPDAMGFSNFWGNVGASSRDAEHAGENPAAAKPEPDLLEGGLNFTGIPEHYFLAMTPRRRPSVDIRSGEIKYHFI
jgi:hypothetical protein